MYFTTKKISGDSSTDLQVIKHAIESIKNFDYDLIAYMRPTTPIRNLKNVNDAIKKFSSSNFSSLRSIHEMSETAYKSYEVKRTIYSIKKYQIKYGKIEQNKILTKHL